MPTVIDSLIVELALDPANFTPKAKEAIDNLGKLEKANEKRSKGNVEGARHETDALASLSKTAVGLFAIFTGITGIKEFITGTINAGASVGRLSRAIGVSAVDIAKWQGVAREFGSTGENMAAAFQSMSNVFTAWQVGGPEAPQVMQILRAIQTQAEVLDKAGAKSFDSSKGVTQFYSDLAANLKIIHDLAQDKNLASYLAGKIPGMDAGMIDLLVRGNEKLAESLKKVNGWTDAQAEAAGRLQQRWEGLKVSAENLGLRALFGTMDFISSHPMFVLPDSKPAGTFTQPSVNSESVASGFKTPAQKEAFIRSEAAKRGINPDAAMAVAKSEGFDSFISRIPGETSYGAFQLNVTPGGQGGHQGDLFRKATGLDPADPKNEAAGILWALDDIQKTGWQHYHGAANGAHLSNWAGIDRSGGGSGGTTMQFNGPITVSGVSGPEDFTRKLRDLGLKRQAEANQSSVGGQ